MRNLSLLLFLISFSALSQDRINNSTIAFSIPEKDLLPESIAYDPALQMFYVSSTRKGKVVRVDANGNTSDFIDQKEHGLWMTIGMKVDAQRRILWVCSSGGDNLTNYKLKDEIDGRPAGIFKFDLNTGKLLQKFIYEKKGEVHFINDLIVNEQNGDIYFTHMFSAHSIYKLKWNKTPELLIQSSEIPYPNGLAIADNRKSLFVAHSNGISKIDLASRKITLLSTPEGSDITKKASIDGLYYRKWSLIGVHPGTNQVTRMYINEDGDGIKEVLVLEQNHPMMMNPTTGVLVGSEFYYIASAQFGSFNEDGSLWSMEKLFEPVILKVNID